VPNKEKTNLLVDIFGNIRRYLMDNQRRKILIESMKKINKINNESLAVFAEDTTISDVLPSGINTVDKLIGKGFKKGNFTILWGGESVGKSTLALQTIATAQNNGQIACYLDMERSFDATRAIELGVNLEELMLVSNCQTAEQALEIIRSLSKDKAVDMIILDSVQSMSPIGEQENKGKERELASKEMAELARTLSKFFRVVAPDVYRAKIACILIGQVRMNLGSFIVKAELSGGLALKHFAYQSVFMRRGQKADAPVQKFKEYFIDPDGKIRSRTIGEEVGFDTVLKLSKTKSSLSEKEGSEIHVPFVYDKGFVNEIVEPDELEIRIDTDANEKDRQTIEDFLREKNLLKEPINKTNITLPDTLKKDLSEIKVKEKNEEVEKLNDVLDKEDRFPKPNEVKEIVEPKKKKGRPKKVDKT
jgi:protein RecA